MQKNAFSYVLGVAALSLLCSCGAGKKEEVKVDAKEAAPVEQTATAPEANKEVALAEQQPTAEAAATENTTVAQAEVPADAAKASEENKAA